MQAVPHLNELHEKYGEQGLLIVGVSNEDADKIRDKMEAVGMEFAVGRSAKDVIATYGVRGIPATFLIDRAGELVWSGHPSAVTDELIESVLE